MGKEQHEQTSNVAYPSMQGTDLAFQVVISFNPNAHTGTPCKMEKSIMSMFEDQETRVYMVVREQKGETQGARQMLLEEQITKTH